MGLPGISTTADPLSWEDATRLYESLIKEEEYRLAAMVIIGMHTGLRISDIRNLTWRNIILEDCEIQEHKTGKDKVIYLSPEVKCLLYKCYAKLKTPPLDQHFLLSQKKTVYTIQRLNNIMKYWKIKYNLAIKNISTHSLRKTMALRVLTLYNDDKIKGLKIIQGALNHDRLDDTLRYLGIPLETYTQWENKGKLICL